MECAKLSAGIFRRNICNHKTKNKTSSTLNIVDSGNYLLPLRDSFHLILCTVNDHLQVLI